MAEKLTSADIIAFNTSEEILGVILEASKMIPEMDFFAASPVASTYYKTMVRTALPTAGFRGVGAGRVRDKGTLTQRIVQCSYLDASWDEDEASFTGVDWGNLEGELQGSHLLAALKSWQSAIYNGPAASPDTGFPGMCTLFPNTDSDGVIDAGGTTATTGSSIYLVKTGEQQTSLVWGQNGEIAAGDIFPTVISYVDGGATKKYNARAQKIEGWAGLQIANSKSIVRIANVTEDAAATASDFLVHKGIQLFEERYGWRPDGILMSYRSRTQLQNSRTAINTTGQDAPTPVEVDGIPVIATLGIGKTETLLAHS